MSIGKRFVIPSVLGVTAFAGVAGGSMLNSLMATAESTSPTSTTATTTNSSSQTTQQSQPDPSQGGHVGANGVKEVLLTGDTATNVTAAAQAAVPGATIERVETDAEGSKYEAHVVKSDGTHVTVKVDESFKVTSVDTDQATSQTN